MSTATAATANCDLLTYLISDAIQAARLEHLFALQIHPVVKQTLLGINCNIYLFHLINVAAGQHFNFRKKYTLLWKEINGAITVFL